MSAGDEYRDWAAGHRLGRAMFAAGSPRPRGDVHEAIERGLSDGWDYAKNHQADTHERALIDGDQQYRGAALRPDPPIGTKEAL